MVLDRKSLKFHLKHNVFLVPSDLALRFQWNFIDFLPKTFIFVMKNNFFQMFIVFLFFLGRTFLPLDDDVSRSRRGYTPQHSHTRTRTRTHTHRHTHTHTQTRTRTRTHTHRHTHAHTRTHTHNTHNTQGWIRSSRPLAKGRLVSL